MLKELLVELAPPRKTKFSNKTPVVVVRAMPKTIEPTPVLITAPQPVANFIYAPAPFNNLTLGQEPQYGDTQDSQDVSAAIENIMSGFQAQQPISVDNDLVFSLSL